MDEHMEVWRQGLCSNKMGTKLLLLLIITDWTKRMIFPSFLYVFFLLGAIFKIIYWKFWFYCNIKDCTWLLNICNTVCLVWRQHVFDLTWGYNCCFKTIAHIWLTVHRIIFCRIQGQQLLVFSSLLMQT